MTTAELEKLGALAKQATQKTHEYVDSNPRKAILTQGDVSDHPCSICGKWYGHNNAKNYKDFESAVSPDVVLALIAEVKRLRELEIFYKTSAASITVQKLTEEPK